MKEEEKKEKEQYKMEDKYNVRKQEEGKKKRWKRIK